MSNMQKGTIVKIPSILQCQKYPKEYAKDSKIVVSLSGNSKKPILLNRKPLKKQKIEKKIDFFFQKNVSGKSHNAENRDEPLGFFNIHSFAKYQYQIVSTHSMIWSSGNFLRKANEKFHR